MSAPSQIDRLLDALAPGYWVSTAELLRAVPCIVHSRISEARSRGHVIEHRTVGKGASGSQYRLVCDRPPGLDTGRLRTYAEGSTQWAGTAPTAPPRTRGDTPHVG